jgi:hypothetical protein
MDERGFPPPFSLEIFQNSVENCHPIWKLNKGVIHIRMLSACHIEMLVEMILYMLLHYSVA